MKNLFKFSKLMKGGDTMKKTLFIFAMLLISFGVVAIAEAQIPTEGMSYTALNGLRFIGFTATYNSLPTSSTAPNSYIFVLRGTNDRAAGIYRRYPAKYNSLGQVTTNSGWILETRLFSDNEIYAEGNSDEFSTVSESQSSVGWTLSRNASSNFSTFVSNNQLIIRLQNLVTNGGENAAYTRWISTEKAAKIRVKAKLLTTTVPFRIFLNSSTAYGKSNAYCLAIYGQTVTNAAGKYTNIKLQTWAAGTFSTISASTVGTVPIKTNQFYIYELTRTGTNYTFRVENAASGSNYTLLKTKTYGAAAVANYQDGVPMIEIRYSRAGGSGFPTITNTAVIEYIRIYRPVFVRMKQNDN